MKRMILLFVFLTVLFSCRKRDVCVECATLYTPRIIPPKIFVVCNPAEVLYWNGRTEDYIDAFGNHITTVTICKINGRMFYY